MSSPLRALNLMAAMCDPINRFLSVDYHHSFKYVACSTRIGARRMPQPNVRLKLGRRPQGRTRKNQGAPASQVTALVQGRSQVQINDGNINVIGRDSHTHVHYHGTKIDLEPILRAIPNFRKIHQDALAKATPGTGIWLLRAAKFKLWLEPNGDLHILWGSGIPGAGKTVLASLVIDTLEAMARESGRRLCIAYVYFRYSDQSEITLRTVLEVLARQAAERHPELCSIFQQVYDQHDLEGTEPTETQLLDLLQDFTMQLPATFYILDALDEAPVGMQLALLKKLSSLNCKLFITSRPLKAVEAHFPDAYTFPIVAHDEDIDLHIKHKIESSADLQGLLAAVDCSVREEIVNAIKQKCGGMFLHASLQLDAICQCVSLYDVRETLEVFPPELEDAYHQTWRRILAQNPKHVLLAKHILLWVLYARRPMTIDELQRAVATSPVDHIFDSSRIVPVATLVGLCRGLVAVEEESRLVRLVHSTAKEIMHRLLRDSFPNPHPLLTSVCINRLFACGLQNTSIDSKEDLEQVLQADPLLAYAHDAWAFHARHSLEDARVASHLTVFISGCRAFPQLIDGTGKFDLLCGIHLAAFFDLPIARPMVLVATDENVTTRKEGNTPLGLACWRGNQTAAHSLLSLPNILVNARNGDGMTALMLAALGGHEGVVALLLACPDIEINLMDTNGWSALMHAAFSGHEAVVTLLLAHPDVETNLMATNGQTALMRAAWNGHRGTVEVLLAHHDIEINPVTPAGWSALMNAAFNGHEDTVRLLLTRPEVEVNLASASGSTALMRAAWNDYEGTVALLLAHPDIEVNLVDTSGYSALMRAALNGHESIVKLVLDHPQTKVNLVSKDGSSALTKAVLRGHEGVVRLLLATPDIDVNAIDGHGDTALKIAAEHGHEEIVRILFDVPGIDIAMAGGQDGLTVTLAALAQRHKSIAHLLQAFKPGNGLSLVSTDQDASLPVGMNSEEGELESDDEDIYEDAVESF